MSEANKVETNIDGKKIVRDPEYKYGFVHSGVDVYTFDFGASSTASTSILSLYNDTTITQPQIIGDFKIVPNGPDNTYPEELRTLLDNNNILFAITNKKVALLFGQGTAFYQERFENGKRIKYFDEVPEIQKWLDDWDYNKYLEEITTEFQTSNGYYSAFYRNLGTRIGKKSYITKLKSIANRKARLEWYDENDNVNAIIVGNYTQPWEKGLKRYPIWDRMNPFEHPVSMRYNNLYGFALDNEYSRAPFHGSINSIKLGSSIAVLLQSFNDNSAAIKYHIRVPAIFWEQKTEKLQEQCIRNNEELTQKMIDKMKDDHMRKFVDVLSSYKNVGKIVQTDSIWHEDAEEFVGWTIEVLDQKVGDFITAQLDILKQMSFEISAGMDLHPAISNISREGNLPSGSEQLYAFKLYLMTGVYIPEMIVMKDINDAIQANFPGTKYKLGFYHDAVLTEEATAPKDRIKNSSSAPGNPTNTKRN